MQSFQLGKRTVQRNDLKSQITVTFMPMKNGCKRLWYYDRQHDGLAAVPLKEKKSHAIPLRIVPAVSVR